MTTYLLDACRSSILLLSIVVFIVTSVGRKSCLHTFTPSGEASQRGKTAVAWEIEYHLEKTSSDELMSPSHVWIARYTIFLTDKTVPSCIYNARGPYH